MKLLFIDVEVAPNIATVWGIFKQNIAINQLQETSRVMCYTAQWHGEPQALFGSELEMGHENMILSLHDLLDEADMVCHYNGDRFDIPVINREFLKYELLPPAPYKSIDLLKTIRRKFRFTSNKMDHIAKELGIEGKVSHEGHELWLKCMAGDKKAWKTMEEYNVQDVVILSEMYERVRPWITNHPNLGLYTDSLDHVCPNCGGTHLVKRGIARTNVMKYQRYRCSDCGTWSRARYAMKDETSHNVVTQVK